jgi:hypothetical protein
MRAAATRTLIAIAVATGALAPLTAHAQSVQLLAATNVISAPGSRLEMVDLSTTATLHFATSGSGATTAVPPAASPDVAISGNGRMTGFMLSGVGSDPLAHRVALLVVNDNHCRTTACVPVNPTQLIVATPAVQQASARDSTGMYAVHLNPGLYDLQVVADGAPVTITLRLEGLRGSQMLQPSGATDLQLMSPGTTTSAGARSASVMYSLGSSGVLAGAGGIAFSAFDFVINGRGTYSSGRCVYGTAARSPYAFAPGCGHRARTASSEADQTLQQEASAARVNRTRTFIQYGAGWIGPGTGAIGDWLQTAAPVTSTAGTDMLLSFTGPGPAAEVPDLPGPLGALIASGIASVVWWRRRESNPRPEPRSM